MMHSKFGLDLRRRSVVLTCWVLLTLSTVSGAAPLAEAVWIRRDNFNVPHISGETDAACAYGLAWAQCEDYFGLLAVNLLAGQGRMAEWQGRSALDHDRFVLRHRIPQVVEEGYSRLSASARGLLEGYAAGVNAYVQRHPSDLGTVLGPVRGQDVASFARMIVLGDFVLNQGSYRQAMSASSEFLGSNMWALGPSRTETGSAMLLVNPHLSWAGRHYWYEAHLKSAEGYEMSGAGFFGLPLPVIGHGRHIAWSHTVNNIDLVDLWEERVTGNPPSHYEVDEQRRPVRQLSLSIRYREAGELIQTNYTEFRTHRGPLLQNEEGRWFSVRSSVDDEVDFVSPWYRMAQSTSVPDLIRSLDQCRPATFNILAADTQGNIYYVYNGRPPGRPVPTPRNGVWPGWNSRYEPEGILPFSRLPQLLNPRCGYLQNCNSTPFRTTLTNNPPEELIHASFVQAGMTLRAHSALRLLESLRKCSWEQFGDAAFDNRCEAAARVLPELITFADRLSSERREAQAAALAALDLMRGWDYRARADSVAMTLYSFWWEAYTERAKWFAQDYDGDPLATPRGLGDPERAWELWCRTADRIRERYGVLRKPWGEVQVIHRGGREFPLGGSRESSGCLRVTGGQWEGNQFLATGGDSYVMAVHLTEPIEAVSVHPLGNSNEPSDPHYLQQTELFSLDRFKPAWFSEADIRDHTERRYRPGS